MRTVLLSTILGAGLFLTPIVYAQTSSVTATCKDGSNFSGSSRSGACRGHGGVANWGTAAAATEPGMAPAAAPPTRSASASPASPPATIPNKGAYNTSGTSGSAAAKTGGPGQVWVNSSTKVFHCPGDRYYGKTKSGEFMSQSAAQAAGDRPAGGKACAS